MIEFFPLPDAWWQTLSVRQGPDRLPLLAFKQAPWQIRCVAYWYHDHVLCRDPDCECENPANVRAGDGICAVAYADGHVGVYGLTHLWPEELLNWERINIIDRMTLAEFEQLRRDRELPSEVLDATTWDAAIEGFWAAVDEAVRRGLWLSVGNGELSDVTP
jgi:prepilin-type processing-associated H-X9-DG protein